MSIAAQCHHLDVALLDVVALTAGPPTDQRYLWCRDCGLLLNAFPKVEKTAGPAPSLVQAERERSKDVIEKPCHTTVNYAIATVTTAGPDITQDLVLMCNRLCYELKKHEGHNADFIKRVQQYLREHNLSSPLRDGASGQEKTN